ncbi:hypothetical protein D3C80_1681160 [compost metagenome]
MKGVCGEIATCPRRTNDHQDLRGAVAVHIREQDLLDRASARPNGACDEVVVGEAGIGTRVNPHAVATNTARLKLSFRHDHHSRCSRKDIAHDPSRLISGWRGRRRQQYSQAKQVRYPHEQTTFRRIGAVPNV